VSRPAPSPKKPILESLGRVAEALVLTRYMKGLLLKRNRYLKQVAEAGTDAAFLS